MRHPLVRGRLRVLHTQLLVRRGHRTPLQALSPEAFWTATLPTREFLSRLDRAGNPRSGPRRRHGPTKTWGELTTRGADEAFAVGRRLSRWLHEREGAHTDEWSKAVTVHASHDRRARRTARAVISGLNLADVRIPVNTSQAGSFRVHSGHLLETAHEDLLKDAEARQNAALELMEVLRIDQSELGDGHWTRLLDVVESSLHAGLLPQGSLSDATWNAVFDAPCQLAGAVEVSSLPLLQMTLRVAVRAARSDMEERARIYVVPGFSLLCWARATGLSGASLWPSPASGVLLETLADQADNVFVRFWDPRDSWEFRPSWHNADGPVSLSLLLEKLQTGQDSPKNADARVGDERL